MMSRSRIARMADAVESEDDAYTPSQLLDDITTGIFGEPDAMKKSVDVYQRNLQRAYVTRLIDEMESASSTSDLPGLARAQLVKLSSVGAMAAGAKNDATAAHYSDLQARIEKALDVD